MSYGILGCPEQDSNLHASQHSHLKRARLPFRHLGFCSAKLGFFGGLSKCFFPFYAFFMFIKSIGVFFAMEGIVYGAEDNLDVQKQRPMFYIPYVMLHPALHLP